MTFRKQVWTLFQEVTRLTCQSTSNVKKHVHTNWQTCVHEYIL